MKKDDEYRTVCEGEAAQIEAIANGFTQAMRVVFEDGTLLMEDSFKSIRERADEAAKTNKLGYFSASAA
jgi:hypothetical protein